jgi:hypothetical protein
MGPLFDDGDLTANSQTFVWVVIFFFASAGASAAYLTVSDTWPIEIRSEAIAVFFTIGTIFGAIGPAFYGALIGINAEGKSLEDITRSLTAADQTARPSPTTTPPTTTPPTTTAADA